MLSSSHPDVCRTGQQFPAKMVLLIRRALVVLLLLPAFPLPAQNAAAPPEGLRAGDQIRIVVWRKPELSGDFAVSANGTIAHPLYREVQVTGVPIAVVEERLRTFLLRYEASPQLVVEPLIRIAVGGEVRTPNVYSVPPQTTVAQAIALAGGPTERGRLNRVSVIRARQQIMLDLTRPESEAFELQARSGDQIAVGRSATPMREYIGPIFSGIAAIAAIISIFVQPGSNP